MIELKVELTKLMKKTSTKIFLIIYGVILIGMSGIYIVTEKVYNLSAYTTTQFVSTTLGLMMAFILPLMAIYLSSSSQSLDFSRGTMKNMYLLPTSRMKIFLSKLLSVQTILAGVLGVSFIFSYIVSIINEGFSFIHLGGALTDYIGAFFILGLINILGNLLTLLLKNTGLTVIVAYIGFIGLRLATAYFPVIKSISLTTILTNYENIFNYQTMALLLSTLAYYIILFIAGLLLFEKKEESLCQFD